MTSQPHLPPDAPPRPGLANPRRLRLAARQAEPEQGTSTAQQPYGVPDDDVPGPAAV